MGAGIEKALDMIEARNAIYRASGVAYYRPWLLIITDGAPTDDVSRAGQRIEEAEGKRKVPCIGIEVESADSG
jgi:uncharacterized protein YegL